MTAPQSPSANRFRFRMWVKEYKIEEDVIPAHMDYNPKFSQSVTRTWEARNDMTMDMTRGASVRVNDGFSCPIDGVWMQSTGLLDKNGKEIFEGDILRSDTGGVPWVSTAEWQQACSQFVMRIEPRKTKFGQWSEFRLSPNETRYEFGEVIGSIYENPELLSDVRS